MHEVQRQKLLALLREIGVDVEFERKPKAHMGTDKSGQPQAQADPVEGIFIPFRDTDRLIEVLAVGASVAA